MALDLPFTFRGNTLPAMKPNGAVLVAGHTTFLLMVLGSLAPGCSSLTNAIYPSGTSLEETRIYGGVRSIVLDFQPDRRTHDFFFVAIARAIDFLPSAVVDTVLLPYTIPVDRHSARLKPILLEKYRQSRPSPDWPELGYEWMTMGIQLDATEEEVEKLMAYPTAQATGIEKWTWAVERYFNGPIDPDLKEAVYVFSYNRILKERFFVSYRLGRARKIQWSLERGLGAERREFFNEIDLTTGVVSPTGTLEVP